MAIRGAAEGHLVTHRIALIHAVTPAMQPVRDVLERMWPQAECVNLLDDSLAPHRALDADLSPALTRRIHALADYAMQLGADGILYTCSAFGAAIESVAAQATIPVLKPNEAMFEDALALGSRVVMLVTFPTAAQSMRPEFEALASVRAPAARLQTHYVAGAADALRSGDMETHNRLIADAARGFADADALMLGQFSMAPAAEVVAEATGRPVLTSPSSAVRKLKVMLEYAQQ